MSNEAGALGHWIKELVINNRGCFFLCEIWEMCISCVYRNMLKNKIIVLQTTLIHSHEILLSLGSHKMGMPYSDQSNHPCVRVFVWLFKE